MMSGNRLPSFAGSFFFANGGCAIGIYESSAKRTQSEPLSYFFSLKKDSCYLYYALEVDLLLAEKPFDVAKTTTTEEIMVIDIIIIIIIIIMYLRQFKIK